MSGQVPTIIFGNDLAWWVGILGGVCFLVLIVTAFIKQYNWKIFMKWQVPLTPIHHWSGWLTVGFLFVHFLLTILQFNFHVFF